MSRNQMSSIIYWKCSLRLIFFALTCTWYRHERVSAVCSAKNLNDLSEFAWLIWSTFCPLIKTTKYSQLNIYFIIYSPWRRYNCCIVGKLSTSNKVHPIRYIQHLKLFYLWFYWLSDQRWALTKTQFKSILVFWHRCYSKNPKARR